MNDTNNKTKKLKKPFFLISNHTHYGVGFAQKTMLTPLCSIL